MAYVNDISYDLFPVDGKTLTLKRDLCTTIPEGQDEPQYDPRHDKVEEVIDMLEVLEPGPEEDFDLALPDSDDDNDDDDEVSVGGTSKPTKPGKKKKKKTRKVLSKKVF
jgi:hypothetical protein